MLKVTRISKSSWFKFVYKGVTLYIDPGYAGEIDNQKIPYKELTDADLILVSHVHMDHLKKEALDLIWKTETKVYASKSCLGHMDIPMEIFLPMTTLQTHGLTIQSIHAYNTETGRSTRKYHPKDDFLGFILYFDDFKVYFAGDTDIIPEMRELKDIDLAMLPISGTYVMDLDEAIEATQIITPTYVIPMHQGLADLNEFKKKVITLTASTPIVLDNGDSYSF
jgi:L-ascorbate metabolism protein UlaG (beta-lactamase superfamily)